MEVELVYVIMRVRIRPSDGFAGEIYCLAISDCMFARVMLFCS